LRPHARELVAIDFFAVPTLTFRLLFVFVGLRHDRRELIHLNVTEHPTAGWATRQLIEAFPEETALKYLLRDRDAIYSEVFTRSVAQMEDPAGHDRPQSALAEPVRGAGDRLHPP
jgi:hypothetical protein